MKKVPTLKAAMTPFPYSVQLETTLTTVRKLIQDHNIHHIPVMNSGEIVGVITGGDVEAREKMVNGDNEQSLEVLHVHMSKPYIVDINEPFENVLLTMADKHIGATVITKHGKLVGVFTYIDACRYFGEYLQAKFPKINGNDAA
ncbi:MAG: CBS domain-containing protein [Gammaproteobacteria bacterium]|nr:CBS domain-containing protein [Gammaproteobacteria bacterium]